MGSIDAEAERHATEAVPTVPRDMQGPVFHEPREAQAFALALTLHDKGLFAWTEWAAMLGEEIKKAQDTGDPDAGTTYYRHWMATLERMETALSCCIRSGRFMARLRKSRHRNKFGG